MRFFQFASEKGLEYNYGWIKANQGEAAAMGEAQRSHRAEKQAKRRAAMAEREERARVKRGQFRFIFYDAENKDVLILA
jgi:hypothetical protein